MKLKKLLAKAQAFKEYNTEIPQQLLDEIKAAESKLCAELFPKLQEANERVLDNVPERLIFLVEYNPERDRKVSVSCVHDLDDIFEGKYLEAAKGVVLNEPKEEVDEEKLSGKVKFCVVRPEGSRIKFEKGSKTMVATIREIGADRVAALGLQMCGLPLVDDHLDKKYAKSQYEVGDGLYLNTSSGTKTKVKQLREIFRLLSLKGWRVVTVDHY
jgi:hypothetical protein